MVFSARHKSRHECRLGTQECVRHGFCCDINYTGGMIETRRLLLRRWRPDDREPFFRINSDPRVMRFFVSTLSRAESDALAARIEANWDRQGFGQFAAEMRDEGRFCGFIGLSVPGFEAHFTPCVEIGWRLGAEFWNRGLATEGARAVLDYAFQTLGLAELVSFTVPDNLPSRRVMEKIGMSRDPADDFDHPRIVEGHPLRRHVLYRVPRGVYFPSRTTL
jgi:RimJ/RimL family protein N-acetyltransferase